MPFALLAAETHAHFKELLHRADFLTLTDSKTAFPHSKGAGLPLIHLATDKCEAYIALQGAHLLSFQTRSGAPLLWLSPNCDFTAGVALRGGIPVCLPWFGPHPTDSSKPKHGFARNRDWQLDNAHLQENGDAILNFRFDSPANELFPFHFEALLTMTLGDSIHMEITIANKDTNTFDCSWVLHSYFPVDSLADVRVKGLAERTYLDNLESHAAKHQAGDLEFPQEVDRVFPAIENSLEIAGAPRIRIDHSNCPSVVTWNPGATNAAKIGDIGAGNEQGYVCVERGAVLGEKWRLEANQSMNASMTIYELTPQ